MNKKLNKVLMIPALCLLSSSLFAIPNKQIDPLLSKRYSGYEFDGSKMVTAKQIHSIMEAGRVAPSSYNEQPWRFIFCDKNYFPQSYEKAFSTLVEFNQNWAKNASLLIISVAATNSTHNGKFNEYAEFDTGAAAYSMMLQATSLGLMAHQMGGFDQEQVRKLFAIPEDYKIMSIIAIGYPDKNSVQPERNRKPITDNFYVSGWGVIED